MKKLLQGQFAKYALITLCAISLSACKTHSDGGKKIVEKMLNGQGTITKTFSATDNLQGFVVSPYRDPARKSIIYADNAGKYIFLGNIISADGKNLSQSFYQKYVADVGAPKAYADAAKTHWFLAGSNNAPHKAYMIVEPNCSACHLAYQKLKPMIDSGQLAVRFILVAFLKPDSAGKAAAILTAKKPSSAYALDEKKFVMRTESGGIKPLKKIDAATQAKIKTNIAFMQHHQFAATPVLIYKTSNGKYHTQIGFPGNDKAVQDLVNSFTSKF